MDSKTYFQNGQLQLAIAAMNNEVKSDLQNISKRSFLWELLCISGDFERAAKQLDIITQQEPAASVTTASYRQLMRAEQTRRQCFLGKQRPEFIGEITPAQQHVLQALSKLQANENEQAHIYLQQAEALRPQVYGACNGAAFHEIRDCDDVCAGFFEILTSNGQYYWLPFEKVAAIELQPPQHPIDLIWRRAHLTVREGPEGDVYLPVIYAMPPQEDEAAQLGHKTEWQKVTNHFVRGIGQRLYLIGNQDLPIMALKTLVIEKVMHS